jgi:methylglutamate dehydrogenase subunit A
LLHADLDVLARMTLPEAASVVVIGAGIHGLSVAYHVSELLDGSPRDVVVLEKRRVGAGASGISGGIVRNFYLSPAINEIVRQSVEIFEIEPAMFGFRQVGYLAVVPEAQAVELEQIAVQHAAIGYASTLTRGADEVDAYMHTIPTGGPRVRLPFSMSSAVVGPTPSGRSPPSRAWPGRVVL